MVDGGRRSRQCAHRCRGGGEPKSSYIASPCAIVWKIRVALPVICALPGLPEEGGLERGGPSDVGRAGLDASRGKKDRAVLVVIVVAIGQTGCGGGCFPADKGYPVGLKKWGTLGPRGPKAEAEADEQESHQDVGKSTR